MISEPVYPKKTELINIKVDGPTQTRENISLETIDHYAEIYGDPARAQHMPPLSVFLVGQQLVLVDGFHRWSAMLKAGRADGMVIIVGQGTMEDAIAKALTFNHKHGLHRTSADKRKAVKMAMDIPRLAELSTRELAAHCGVSHQTVHRIRTELGQTEEPQASQPEMLDDAPDFVEDDISLPKSRNKNVKAETVSKPETILADSENILRKDANTINAWAKELAANGGKKGEHVARLLDQAVKQMRIAAAGIAAGFPTKCPWCSGKGDCEQCGSIGWTTRRIADTYEDTLQ